MTFNCVSKAFFHRSTQNLGFKLGTFKMPVFVMTVFKKAIYHTFRPNECLLKPFSNHLHQSVLQPMSANLNQIVSIRIQKSTHSYQLPPI